MSKVEIRQTGTSNVVVASEVASPFATVAVSAANSANAAWDSFRSVYYGAFATAPSADPLGNPISVGDLYFDTTISALMVWGGSAWQTYNPATISTAALTDWPAAVSVTELGYLDGVTGSIQAQIDNKAPASRTISTGAGLTGGGDLSADRNLAAVTLPQSDWTAGSSNVDAVVSPADISAAIVALGNFNLIETRIPAGGETALDFTNLGAYSVLLLTVNGLNYSTNGAHRVRVSTDNGATWLTTGYSGKASNSAGATAVVTDACKLVNSTRTTLEAGMILMVGFNSSIGTQLWGSLKGQEFSNYACPAGVNNAIRFYPSTAGVTFSAGGEVSLWGMK